jgi:predicted Zn-dependent peptidase
LESRLSKVTAADVASVANRYFQPDVAKVIAVGDRAATEEQLRSLGLGSIVTRDADGR